MKLQMKLLLLFLLLASTLIAGAVQNDPINRVVGSDQNDTILTSLPGTIFGNDGNDTITGSTGDDIIYGDDVSTLTYELNISNIDFNEHNISRIEILSKDHDVENHYYQNIQENVNNKLLLTLSSIDKNVSIKFVETVIHTERSWWYNFVTNEIDNVQNSSLDYQRPYSVIANLDINITNELFNTMALYAYVVDSSNDIVDVVNVATEVVEQNITVGSGAGSITSSRDNKFVFVSNYTANSISVINTVSNTVDENIIGIPSPSWSVVSRDNSMLYAKSGTDRIYEVNLTNYTANDLTGADICSSGDIHNIDISADGSKLYAPCVLDNGTNSSVIVVPTDGTAFSTITNVGNTLNEAEVSPDGQFVYVQERKDNDADNQIELYKYDISNDTFVRDYDITTSEANWQIEIASDNKTAYIANSTELIIYDLDAASVMSTHTLPSGSSIGLVLSPDEKYVYMTISNSAGIHIFDTVNQSFSFVDAGFATNTPTYRVNSTFISKNITNIVPTLTIENISNSIGTNTNVYGLDLAISRDGTKAYVAGYTGLVIVNITNPNAPIILGSLDTNSPAYDVTLSSDGTKAYVAASSAGLVIVNITNPNAPIILGSLDTNGSAYGVALSRDETIVYVADNDLGVVVVDISDETNPFSIATHDTTGYAEEIVLNANESQAYIADGNKGLEIINISTPSAPSSVGNLTGIGYVNAVALSADENTIFAAVLGAVGTGLVIIDVSTAISPASLFTLDTQGYWPHDISLSSDESKVYIADDSNGLVVVDVTTLTSPVLLGAFGTDGVATGSTLSADESKVYIANGSSGFTILDAQISPVPTSIGKYDVTDALPLVLSPDGNTAYIANGGGGLLILDITSPGSPTYLGSYDTVGSAYGVAISADDNRAYIADSGDLVILDVSDKTSPSLLGSYTTAGSAYGVTLSKDGTKAYVADYSSGLSIINVQNSASPSLLGSYDTAGTSRAVTLSPDGTKAYVSDDDNGLVIIDVANSAAPTLLGTFDDGGHINGAVISSDGTKAYLSDFSSSGLEIVNVSNSTAPTLLGAYYSNGAPLGVALSPDEKRAYLADSNKGLITIDITNSSTPVHDRSYSIDGNASKVVVSSDGTKAYVTNTKGFRAVDVGLSGYTNVDSNAGSFDLNITLDDVNFDDINLTVTSSDTSIMNVGAFDTNVTHTEYTGSVITIGFTLTGIVGQADALITINDGNVDANYTHIINVYENSEYKINLSSLDMNTNEIESLTLVGDKNITVSSGFTTGDNNLSFYNQLDGNYSIFVETNQSGVMTTWWYNFTTGKFDQTNDNSANFESLLNSGDVIGIDSSFLQWGDVLASEISVLATGGVLQFSEGSSPLSISKTAAHDAMQNAMSIELWFKQDQNNTKQTLITDDNGTDISFYIGINRFNEINATLFDGSAKSLGGSNLIKRGEWNHILLMHNSSTGALFINGVQKTSNSVSTLNSGGDTIYVGSTSDEDASFVGLMDELRIWDTDTPIISVGHFMYNQRQETNTSLIGHYHFDERVGDTYFDVSADHDAVVSSNAYKAPMRLNFLNSGIDFDGSNYVDVLNNAYNYSNSQFTISTWAKFESVTSMMLLHMGSENGEGDDGFSLKTVNGQIQFRAYGNQNIAIDSRKFDLNDSQWHNYTITYNGYDAVLYIDGERENSHYVESFSMYDDSEPLYFGADAYFGDKNFYGQMAEVVILS
jgi:hypothetical protein